jgi:hypothetical protein
MKQIEARRADEYESERLVYVMKKMLELFDKYDLTTADVMNLLTNVVSEIAVMNCMDRESLIKAVGQTYDAHLLNDSKDETVN